MTNQNLKWLIIKSLFYILTLAAVCLFWKNNFLILAILFFLAAALLIILKDINSFYFYIAVAAFGAFSEIICVYAGAWQYAKPQFLGIPFWLPFVWGMAGLCFKDIYQFIKLK